MHTKFRIIILLLITLLILVLGYNFLYKELTGFLSLSSINVTIGDKTSGKLLLGFQSLLKLGEAQQIYAEFINIGTSQVMTRIEENIYGYVNGTLKPLANYYDNIASLNPGMRKGYSTVFVPPDVGLYYIKARASYDGKMVEVWGAFVVYYPITTTIYYVPPIAVTTTTVPVSIGFPELSIEYPERIKAAQGESTLINVTAKNVGDIILHNLKFYVSTSNLINFNINPKQVASLAFNQTAIFLISIDVPSTTPEGLYPFDFNLESDEIKEGGKIELEVTKVTAPDEEGIRKTILNYEFLISEIENEINSASLEGYDVSLANQSLINAKTQLGTAKEYFGLKKFNLVKIEFKKITKSLEDAVFQLASAKLYAYKPPAFLPFFMILIIVPIIAIILIFYYYKRKKEKQRPKLLRELAETETEK